VSAANDLAYRAGSLEKGELKDLIYKLSECMTEKEEVEYLCAQQNKIAAKSKL
jgi:hypothetical protein